LLDDPPLHRDVPHDGETGGDEAEAREQQKRGVTSQE
jgi:hypothetical protein